MRCENWNERNELLQSYSPNFLNTRPSLSFHFTSPQAVQGNNFETSAPFSLTLPKQYIPILQKHPFLISPFLQPTETTKFFTSVQNPFPFVYFSFPSIAEAP